MVILKHCREKFAFTANFLLLQRIFLVYSAKRGCKQLEQKSFCSTSGKYTLKSSIWFSWDVSSWKLNLLILCLWFCGDFLTIIPNVEAGWQYAGLGLVMARNYFPKFKNENLQLSKVFPTICHNFQIIFLSILQASKDIFPSAGLDKHVSLYYP